MRSWGVIMFRLSFKEKILTYLITLLAEFLGEVFLPFWGHWGWFMIYWIMLVCAYLIWQLILDWREMYVWGMQLADNTIAFPRAGTTTRFAILRLNRVFPPRMLWVMVVHDDSPRIYQGWQLLSRDFPDPVKATTRGINRIQVA